MTLVCAGFFTTSWDRLLAPVIAGYAFKVPILCFGLALAALAADALHDRRPTPATTGPSPGRWLIAILGCLAVPALWAVDGKTAVLQLLAVTSTAVVPFFATYYVVTRYRVQDAVLTAFIRGGVVASVYGLYQLLAFYHGWPQGLTYTGLNGEFGRISAFNQEPGFFGYFLILVLAATVARSAGRKEPLPWLLMAFFSVVLLLAASRATIIMFPLLIALFLGVKISRRSASQLIAVGLLVALAATAFTLAKPDTTTAYVARASTIIDPHEQSSNAVRLFGLGVARKVIDDHPYGVGPGNFYVDASRYGLFAPGYRTDLVVNNMWLQALVDGGWLLLSVEVAFVVVATRRYFRRHSPQTRALMAGWLTVMLPGSLIVSYFFNNHLWAVLALVAACAAGEDRTVQPDASVRQPRGKSRPTGR